MDVRSLDSYDILYETVSDKFGRPALYPQILVGVITIVHGMVSGLNSAFSSVMLPAFQEDPKRPFNYTEADMGLVASMLNLGLGIGAITSGPVTTHFGRVRVHGALLAPVCLLWLVLAFPPNANSAIAARFFIGLVHGVRLAVGQLYVTEVAHVDIRGTQAAVSISFNPFGIFLGALMAKYVHWRNAALITTFAPLIVYPVHCFLPESPVWYLMRGRSEEAEKSLRWLRGPDYNVALELDDMQSHLDETGAQMTSRWDVFRWRYLKPVFFCALVITLRHFTGFGAIISHTHSIFVRAGSTVDPYSAVMITSAVQFVASLTSTRLFEYLGRRKTALLSITAMTIGSSLLGMVSFCREHTDSNMCLQIVSAGWLPLASLIIYLAGFNAGCAGVIFVLISDMVPLQVKNIVTALLLGYNSALAFLVIGVYFPMLRAFQAYGTFWAYASCCFLLGMLFLLFFTETKGESVRELERRLTGHVNSPVSSSTTGATETITGVEPAYESRPLATSEAVSKRARDSENTEDDITTGTTG